MRKLKAGSYDDWRVAWQPDEYVESTGADGVYEVIEEVVPS